MLFGGSIAGPFFVGASVYKGLREVKMAVREGFEPSNGFPLHTFQACAFDHSATSPLRPRIIP